LVFIFIACGSTLKWCPEMAGMSKTKVVVFANLFGVFLLVLFSLWAEVDRPSLYKLAMEDGPIESMSAVLFGVSSICFFLAAYRSDFLKQKKISLDIS
jgi:hypothetical protein